MTPEQFKAIRIRADLSTTEAARLLKLHDRTTILRYERGERVISGPISILMTLLDDGRLEPEVSKARRRPAR